LCSDNDTLKQQKKHDKSSKQDTKPSSFSNSSSTQDIKIPSGPKENGKITSFNKENCTSKTKLNDNQNDKVNLSITHKEPCKVKGKPESQKIDTDCQKSGEKSLISGSTKSKPDVEYVSMLESESVAGKGKSLNSTLKTLVQNADTLNQNSPKENSHQSYQTVTEKKDPLQNSSSINSYSKNKEKEPLNINEKSSVQISDSQTSFPRRKEETPEGRNFQTEKHNIHIGKTTSQNTNFENSNSMNNSFSSREDFIKAELRNLSLNGDVNNLLLNAKSGQTKDIEKGVSEATQSTEHEQNRLKATNHLLLNAKSWQTKDIEKDTSETTQSTQHEQNHPKNTSHLSLNAKSMQIKDIEKDTSKTAQSLENEQKQSKNKLVQHTALKERGKLLYADLDCNCSDNFERTASVRSDGAMVTSNKEPVNHQRINSEPAPQSPSLTSSQTDGKDGFGKLQAYQKWRMSGKKGQPPAKLKISQLVW